MRDHTRFGVEGLIPLNPQAKLAGKVKADKAQKWQGFFRKINFLFYNKFN